MNKLIRSARKLIQTAVVSEQESNQNRIWLTCSAEEWRRFKDAFTEAETRPGADIDAIHQKR